MQTNEGTARACGCDDYLTEPIEEDQPFRKLVRFLA